MSGPPRIDGVGTSTAGLVGHAPQGPPNRAVLVTSLSEYERTFGGAQAGHDLWLGVRLFFLNGGRRAWAVRLGGQSQAAIRAGLAALDGAADLGLLCLPGLSSPAVLAAAAAYARSRRAFYVAEAAGSRPATLNAVRAIASADAGHVAVYLPRLVIPDPTNPAATMRFGPSTAVAGLLARTDIERGVWAFAAGTTARVQGAVGLGSAIDARGAALLRRSGVNALRTLPGHGIVAWGARAVGGGRDRGEDWKYVPVRRLALYLEESIDRGMDWAAFEPNDEPTWRTVREVVETFLDWVFRAGGLAGDRPEDAFFVRCGTGTTTQRDIENGVQNIEIGVAPLRPAEFVEFRIRHTWS
jgi:Bacteriophage tail sheath protein